MPQVTTNVLLAVFAATGLTFLVLWIVVSSWLSRRRAQAERLLRPGEDSEPTIVLDDVLLPPGGQGWWRHVRRGAQERLERTQLPLEMSEALAIILFCGVALAAAVFFWRYQRDEA